MQTTQQERIAALRSSAKIMADLARKTHPEVLSDVQVAATFIEVLIHCEVGIELLCNMIDVMQTRIDALEASIFNLKQLLPEETREAIERRN